MQERKDGGMSRWHINGCSIEWNIVPGTEPHTDDIEMSGLGVSYIVKYGVNADGTLYLQRHCVWPVLRTIPNNTHASYQTDIKNECVPSILINGKEIREFPGKFILDGTLRTESSTSEENIYVRHVCFPSAGKMNAYELITVENKSGSPVSAEFAGGCFILNSYARGTKGVYLTEVILGGCVREIAPHSEVTAALTFTSRIANEKALDPMAYEASAEAVKDELLGRMKRVYELTSPLELETGNPEIDTMFRFAKLRAGESIFRTKGGLLHSPGGYSYYAATWCNDQIEYSGPWFAYTGDGTECEAALNAYMQYIPFMSEQYISIPSSVIAEGTDIWEKDRGDEAMYLYGASLFALTLGDRAVAMKLFPAVAWCARFCLRRKNEYGVIASETDELEGRFPSGEANLSTSSLCYGGLTLAAVLARELGDGAAAEEFENEAALLKAKIESYFGADINGFRTYRYYSGNTTLRSWICLPVYMGINDRADDTVRAITSPYLWTENGQLTEERTSTVWDRSTLYGFMSAFRSGRCADISGYFTEYTGKRLLGERVPYAIEAYPEGGKRHLSGESALYCRIFTDGILAIRPRGLHKFVFRPQLPDGLKYLHMRNIKAFGRVFDINVDADGYKVVTGGETVSSGPLGGDVLVEF